MNYCILNGIKSTMIKGLLIQSLPPISKPLMRTSVEEIDGRDGDIVTKLGYSAYDKEMTIGLFGDYDIDQVIQYFNSEGKVIFSNEPDKFYNYQIINQIDFERLIRFKTATVTFHVQPFKYSAVDDLFTYEKNKLFLSEYESTYEGLNVKADGTLKIKGISPQTVEFYVPIKAIDAENAYYDLNVNVIGDPHSNIQLALIHDSPSPNNMFGGTSITLTTSNFGIHGYSREITYNYIWVRVAGNADIDVEIKPLFWKGLSEGRIVKVFNRGNVYSRPKMTVYAVGDIFIRLNGELLFQVALGNDEYITIDGLEMNAYKGDTLKNRLVIGDYSKFILNTGNNEIFYGGDVTKIVMENVSRYI